MQIVRCANLLGRDAKRSQHTNRQAAGARRKYSARTTSCAAVDRDRRERRQSRDLSPTVPETDHDVSTVWRALPCHVPTRFAFQVTLCDVPECQQAQKEKMRCVNQRGLDLIKHFEGLFLKAYKDPVGIWTIGFGHTGLQHNDGTVRAGRKITRDEAERLLVHDITAFAK